jgi:hypothetical protein
MPNSRRLGLATQPQAERCATARRARFRPEDNARSAGPTSNGLGPSGGKTLGGAGRKTMRSGRALNARPPKLGCAGSQYLLTARFSGKTERRVVINHVPAAKGGAKKSGSEGRIGEGFRLCPTDLNVGNRFHRHDSKRRVSRGDARELLDRRVHANIEMRSCARRTS